MSHAYDRDRHRNRPARRRSQAQPESDRDPAQLEALREALGNAAMARMLDPGTTAEIESELGGGKPLDAVAGDASAHEAVVDGSAPATRVHDDATAAELSSKLGAVAFTFGRDIFLAGDAPAIDSPVGRRLLRHELTHVRQQESTAVTRPTRVSSPGSAAERQASAAADGVGTSAGPAPGSAVHRQEMPEEEEVMTMPAQTVHRQVAADEEVEEVEDLEADMADVGEPGEAPAAEAVEAPANPALAALFQASVIDKVEAARAALGSDPPDAAAAHAAFIDASNAISALAPAYQDRDALLHSELMRLGNGTAMYIEILQPHVHGSRSLPDVHAALQSSNYNTLASGIRDRLH